MVRIAQDHRDRFPPAQFLDRIDIDPGLNEPGRKRMPEVVEPEVYYPCVFQRRLKCPLDALGRFARIGENVLRCQAPLCPTSTL